MYVCGEANASKREMEREEERGRETHGDLKRGGPTVGHCEGERGRE